MVAHMKLSGSQPRPVEELQAQGETLPQKEKKILESHQGETPEIGPLPTHTHRHTHTCACTHAHTYTYTTHTQHKTHTESTNQ